MDYTNIELEPGMNRLPQLHNATVWVGRQNPPVTVRVSIAPEIETIPGLARDPGGATVVLPMDWPDALRLALQVLAMAMAQASQVPLPEGVVVPDRNWAGLTSGQRGH